MPNPQFGLVHTRSRMLDLTNREAAAVLRLYSPSNNQAHRLGYQLVPQAAGTGVVLDSLGDGVVPLDVEQAALTAFKLENGRELFSTICRLLRPSWWLHAGKNRTVAICLFVAVPCTFWTGVDRCRTPEMAASSSVA